MLAREARAVSPDVETALGAPAAPAGGSPGDRA